MWIRIVDAFNSGIWYASANEFPKLGDNVVYFGTCVGTCAGTCAEMIKA